MKQISDTRICWLGGAFTCLKGRLRTQAASIETNCPKGARRFSVEAQITGYGGASLGKVPQRSVRNTNVAGTMLRSRSQSKQGRKSVPPPPIGTSEIGSPP